MDGKSINRLVGITTEWTSFEKAFFTKGYFLGEVQLDKVLYSLIHLDESLEVFDLPSKRSILFDRESIRRRVYKASREVKQRFQAKKKDPNFCPVTFMLENDLPLDKICGIFPIIFEDYRLVAHSLRMAWAFFLTMKMKKVDRFSFPQRTQRGIFRDKGKNHFTAIFMHIYSEFKRLRLDSEKDWIKCLKNSLCFHVSTELDQDELPEGFHFNLVPIHFRNTFKKLRKSERIEFFFSLLQSKCLCKEVPESFILDTLIKHRDQLSSPPSQPIDSKTIEKLRKRGSDFGKIVKRFYKPNDGFYPTNKATFAFPRDSGGVKGNLVFENILQNHHTEDPDSRMEPFVIGLFGQPGMGKSTRIAEIVQKLSELFPGVKRDQLTYSRTCNTDHWDGYTGQPITILDDLGQSLEGKDIKEFQTLVSCNPYVLPMADLSEKGAKFCSPIIILTSNLRYGQDLSYIYKDANGILDDCSFWRRIHVPLYIEDNISYQLIEEPSWIRHESLICRKGITRSANGVKTFDQSRNFYRRKNIFSVQFDSKSYKQGIWEPSPENFLSDVKKVFIDRKRKHENYRKTWIQNLNTHTDNPISEISEGFYKEQIAPFLPTSLGFDCNPESSSNSHSLCFPAFPPEGPLPVRVEPIVEPLKVRTITAGKGETFCLKPFQRAMWLALGEEEQFVLTHGTNNLYSAIERIYENSDSGDVWISGDYTAATDSVPIEASKALMEGILEHIEHEPTKRWVMKELSPHLLVYPKKSGLTPVLQESGQLMGSLLSFPLLCLLNDCTAKAINLPSSKYLINGDDILMRAPKDSYTTWKQEVKKFGLSLSLGKNYIHSSYGTVNSQLIYEGSVLETGKQKVLDRRTQVLGECLRDLEYMMSNTGAEDVHALFKTINRKKLRRTVRSISVPMSHGGLSLNWGKGPRTVKSRKTEILIYLHDLFRKIEPQSDCLCIPYLSQQEFRQESLKSMEQTFNEPVQVEEYHEDFIGIPQLKRVQKRIHSNSHLRNLFLGQDIENLPSLSFLKSLQIPFKDKKMRKEIQEEIFRVFFINFLNPNVEYNYELFRNSFLDAVRGTKNASEVAVNYLTPIIELNVKPDYLLQVVRGYKAQNFDSGLFKENLGKELVPKNFDLPPQVESPDFSKEVVESFNFLQDQICGLTMSVENVLNSTDVLNHFKGFGIETEDILNLLPFPKP